MSIHPRDILFYGGGAALQKYGTLSRRTTSIARNGEDVTETFTRSGTAYYVDRAGVLRIAAENKPRVNHWDTVNGEALTTPRLLLEAARTNLVTDSETLGDGGWTEAYCNVGDNADTAPDGTATADRLVEDSTAGQAHGVYDSITKTASTNCAFSVFAKAGTRTWLKLRISVSSHYVNAWFNLSTGVIGSHDEGDTGTFERSYIETYGSDWFRCVLVGDLGTNTAITASIVSATADESDSHNGDGSSYISVWGAQFEDSAEFASSYKKTASGTATRNAEALSFPFWAPPQAMTCYVKFVERGTILAPASTRVLQVSNGTNPRFLVWQYTGNNRYRASLINIDEDQVDSVSVAAPSVGDVVELRVTLSALGVVQIHQSINSAAEVSATATAAQALDSTWGGNILSLNGQVTAAAAVGFNEFEAAIIARGSSHTLADFRAILP